MDDALKIATWRRYNMDIMEVIPCYHALCSRAQPISATEGRLLGPEMVLKLAALRDRVHQEMLDFHLQTCAGADESQTTIQRVRDLVCRSLLVDYTRSGLCSWV